MYINPDEPAFFVPDVSCGLTKREYFAAMALQGILSNAATTNVETSYIVQDARLFADELIKELNKDNETNKV